MPSPTTADKRSYVTTLARRDYHGRVYAVIIPLLFVVVLSLYEPMPLRDLRRRSIELGWDFCVLSFGVIGAVASTSIARDPSSAEPVLTAAFFGVAIAFACVRLISAARSELEPQGWQSLAALFLGSLSLSLPAAFGFIRGVV